jgi:DNA-binding transcriptional MocR family regulator
MTQAFKAALETAYRRRELTRLHVHIGYRLAGWRSATPTHRALARSAGCCKRTVQRALDRMRNLGLLSWTRQVLVGPGWRAMIASRYSLLSQSSVSCAWLRTSVPLSTSAVSVEASQARALAAWSVRRKPADPGGRSAG